MSLCWITRDGRQRSSLLYLGVAGVSVRSPISTLCQVSEIPQNPNQKWPSLPADPIGSYSYV
jgi:hypothetical protein